MNGISSYKNHGYHVFRDALDYGMLQGILSFLDRQSYSQRNDDFAKTGQFSLGTRMSERLLDIPKSDDLRKILKEALGSDELYMHMPPMARFVRPGNDAAGVPAHQDAAYNHHMSDFVTVWIPLTPIDEKCGGVAVYYGSGNSEIVATRKRDGEVWFDSVSIDGFQELTFSMNVGDILLMNKSVVHKSLPNRSRRTRYSMDCRFFGRGDTSSKHYLDMQTFRVVAP